MSTTAPGSPAACWMASSRLGKRIAEAACSMPTRRDLRVVSGYLAENIPLMIRQPHTIYVKKGTPISNDEIDNALNAGRIRKAELEPLYAPLGYSSSPGGTTGRQGPRDPESERCLYGNQVHRRHPEKDLS